jgi:hypothetical protein
MMVYLLVVAARIYAGPIEELPKFEAAWPIDVRQPAGLYRVHDGWVGRNL